MTDRIHALTVILEKDIRDDDVQSLIEAIKCLRNVLEVETHIVDIAEFSARARIRNEMIQKLRTVFMESNEL